ncbi:T. brucei spp.-specific protein [Trypanosoma brucei gambiense DAL972]|uniref:T. brucei spp.-specific protein n=1 Tax=Trypanosoma brucei gambiense (strain MHOM/CI/86/DAL972) TaxID=679716 RepID=C9ZIQ3_TRYB9|nr:T. brucei spp.-specific protein [Trypanosoma brucei gambiense DAL972]CBH09045.1 T. brucei spp.-specific protein [Trypanosoma brucei gambiense DAL972]|eukprot:XP_011771486.1 T. brucei spp.-specific protein [Trypanosoma brucei gambiense DAL972]
MDSPSEPQEDRQPAASHFIDFTLHCGSCAKKKLHVLSSFLNTLPHPSVRSYFSHLTTGAYGKQAPHSPTHNKELALDLPFIPTFLFSPLSPHMVSTPVNGSQVPVCFHKANI